MQRRPLQRYKLITCILPAGRGLELVEQVRALGVESANVHHARGLGKGSRRRGGVALYAQREILTALVRAERADELFEFLYRAADIDAPHAGMLLMESVRRAEPLTLPDLPDEPR